MGETPGYFPAVGEWKLRFQPLDAQLVVLHDPDKLVHGLPNGTYLITGAYHLIAGTDNLIAGADYLRYQQLNSLRQSVVPFGLFRQRLSQLLNPLVDGHFVALEGRNGPSFF